MSKMTDGWPLPKINGGVWRGDLYVKTWTSADFEETYGYLPRRRTRTEVSIEL